MRKVTDLLKTAFILIAVPASFMMASCTGGQKKTEEATPKKDIGIQLYSVRDDMNTNPDSAIAKLGSDWIYLC
ncbi:MAG: hypothetical protein AB2L20_13145 [Mangrovibacterium sp.]